MESRFRKYSDASLLDRLESAVKQECSATVEVIELIAEVDRRKLFLPAGYRSMFVYCVGKLRLSEDAAWMRITVARATRRSPSLLAAVADGRVHLTGAAKLAKHLTPDNACELIELATGKTRAEIEQLLADRFPQADVPTEVLAISVSSAAPAAADTLPFATATSNSRGATPVPERVLTHASEAAAIVSVDVPPPRSEVKPLAPERYLLQGTIPAAMRQLLREACELTSHEFPMPDEMEVLHRALQMYVPLLRKRKFAATDRPRRRHGLVHEPRNPRHIPAEVKRAVWERDGGRCTYRSADGHRCEARTNIEFDHMDEHALGGPPTVSNLRLRCREHNQYGAEQAFGAEFMEHKRRARISRSKT